MLLLVIWTRPRTGWCLAKEGNDYYICLAAPLHLSTGLPVQVMARSDNVVRVALTPKYRDVPLLCQTLTYHMGAPPIVYPAAVDHYCLRYTPPVDDFEMLDILVSVCVRPFTLLISSRTL